MASSTQSLRSLYRRSTECCNLARQKPQLRTQARYIHLTSRRAAKDDSEPSSGPAQPRRAASKQTGKNGLSRFDSMIKNKLHMGQEQFLEYQSEINKASSDKDGDSPIYNFEAETEDLDLRGAPSGLPSRRKPTESFVNAGEGEDVIGDEEDLFEGDDIHSFGHGELEQHREIRHYSRLIAWDLPMLSKYAKPFKLPDSTTPLRFRYTDYLGEDHPAANKVVVEFCTSDLPLTPPQRLKLVKLLGTRYDPRRDVAKMSSDKFPVMAQNKRYLIDLVNTLVAEASGKGKGAEGVDAKDPLDDVPVDFRHVKHKPVHVFPEAWKVTAQRRAELEAQRKAMIEAENAKKLNGEMLVGSQVIQEAIDAGVFNRAAVPVKKTQPKLR